MLRFTSRLLSVALLTVPVFAAAADSAPCTLKVYANSTLELQSGLEELYGLVREPGRGYATFTCINPTNLQSHDLRDAELVVKRGSKEERPELRTWLDVNRYYLVTSFSYGSAEPVLLTFKANEVEEGEAVSFSKEYLFFDR